MKVYLSAMPTATVTYVSDGDTVYVDYPKSTYEDRGAGYAGFINLYNRLTNNKDIGKESNLSGNLSAFVVKGHGLTLINQYLPNLVLV